MKNVVINMLTCQYANFSVCFLHRILQLIGIICLVDFQTMYMCVYAIKNSRTSLMKHVDGEIWKQKINIRQIYVRRERFETVSVNQKYINSDCYLPSFPCLPNTLVVNIGNFSALENEAVCIARYKCDNGHSASFRCGNTSEQSEHESCLLQFVS